MPLIELFGFFFLTRRISSFVYKALYLGDGTVCGLIQIPAAPFVFILSLLMHEVQIKVNPDWFHTSAEVSDKKK